MYQHQWKWQIYPWQTPHIRVKWSHRKPFIFSFRLDIGVCNFKHVNEFVSITKHKKGRINLRRTNLFIYLFIFYLGSFSGTFMNHRTEGEMGQHFINSWLPLPPASQTLRHWPGDYCREIYFLKGSRKFKDIQARLLFNLCETSITYRMVENVCNIDFDSRWLVFTNYCI